MTAGLDTETAPAVVHLLDSDCPPIAAAVVRLLADRLGPTAPGTGPAGGWRHLVVALGDGGHHDWLSREGVPFHRVPFRGRAEPFRSMALSRFLSSRTEPISLIHAHSTRSAACGTAAMLPRPAIRQTPVLVEVYRPPPARRIRWLTICTDQIELSFLARSNELRRILAGSGIAADRVGLLRPPLQMSRINAADRRRVRAGLGLADDHYPVLLAGGWCRREDGQKLVLWTGAILGMLYPNLRVIVPGDGPDRLRIPQWFAQAGFAHLTVACGRRFDWPELLSAADVLVHAAGGESDTTPIGWAMSAAVPVVATAVPGTAELVRDHHNGLLCRTRVGFRADRGGMTGPGPRDLAMQVRQILVDPQLRRRLTDQARHEAYHYFRPSDAVVGYEMLYAQLVSSPPRHAPPA